MSGPEPVRGYLHAPQGKVRGVAVLAHGAGSDAQAPLLVAAAEAFSRGGLGVFRCELPFRRRRPCGPPRAGDAERDRAGLQTAVEALRGRFPGVCLLGGHSYGGRMASILAAGHPSIADALILFSYPLHPPRQPMQLRTAHFGRLRTPALFVHGSRDPFGTLAEMKTAIALIPAPSLLLAVEGAGHDPGRCANLGEALERAREALDQWLPPTSAPSQSPGVE